MVLTTIVTGVYKPTYNWGAPHCMIYQMMFGIQQDFLLSNDGDISGCECLIESYFRWDESILTKRSRKGSIHHYLVGFTTSAYFLKVPIPSCKRDRRLQLFASIPVFPAMFVSSFLCCHRFFRQFFGVSPISDLCIHPKSEMIH